MDTVEQKLREHFSGRIVRKDFLHQIKKGTNVPTFVLEFLLARYCASDDPAEIQAGKEAVLATLHDNYVHPNEANTAQSRVATLGKHRFIDKVHVRYVEREKRHWGELENFASKRVAINERFFKDNERMLEGGVWAEVTVAHNPIEEDNYAFYIENLKPIQLSRFDFDQYSYARSQFSRDEWLSVILRSVGLEPSRLDNRQKLHYIARLIPFVESNYSFIELGPPGTGKSYFFSEFSPYATLVSGGQATKATLFYNNQRRKIGLVGFWDIVAFDEVGSVNIKDQDSIQIMKDYMANGRFSRGTEVIANASLTFVGNIYESIPQLVNSSKFDLFLPLPKEFDLAVMDRLACYLPGWEIPKTSSSYLTSSFGLITDYLAEAFHYQAKHINIFAELSKQMKLGACVEGRDERSIKKTICGIVKILHPDGKFSSEEFEEYLAYAIEARRRVKEQMNKRKPDDEFSRIDLSFINREGQEVVIYCPESKDASATLNPSRRTLDPEEEKMGETASLFGKVEDEKEDRVVTQDPVASTPMAAPQEKHFTIHYGATGFSYESILKDYLDGATEVRVEDPFIRLPHQIHNFVRLCEGIIKHSAVKKISLVTASGSPEQRQDAQERLGELQQSLLEVDVDLKIQYNNNLHDRELSFDNGWIVKIGRGLDFYQKPESWFELGSHDLYLRKCLETKVDIFRKSDK